MNTFFTCFMKKFILPLLLALFVLKTNATTILVSNLAELKSANEKALPGDIIILKDGTWSDCKIEISCSGTEKAPIIFKAQTDGKVLINGKSFLRIGGNHIIIEGLNFKDGSAASGNVWEFRLKDNVANNCRITNCSINDFNNPKRINENYWVALYGKNNRIDHCTFYNKKNLGVLIAVILDDNRSRMNNHLIDSNYFAPRPPLQSNAGEIIRVGVSQHCTFYSNTIIRNNLFDQCNGEVEIISIKSCGNIIRNNVFKECQGGLNLRHGNNNTAEGNIFLGNGKEGTGGVRIINEGNWVVNNLFYKCRGVDFRSPLAIMNGVPHSPAYRYLPVRDAVVANNTFINCTPFSLCEGSDSERSVAPANVFIFKNVFANNQDYILYHVFDKTDSIYFANNLVSTSIKQPLLEGFDKRTIVDSTIQIPPDESPFRIFNKQDSVNLILQTHPILIKAPKNILPKSFKNQTASRLQNGFPKSAGFNEWAFYKKIIVNPRLGMGVYWDSSHLAVLSEKNVNLINDSDVINCATVEDIYKALESGRPDVEIRLTGKAYLFTRPICTTPSLFKLSANLRDTISFKTTKFLPSLFIVPGGTSATFGGLNLDASGCNVGSFLSADTNGSSNHSNILFGFCIIQNLKANNFLLTPKYSILDCIFFSATFFKNDSCNLFSLDKETDNVGYYNVEHLLVGNCGFVNHKGSILNLYRGGKDESTMGPNLAFNNNIIENCTNEKELINLFGVQVSSITNNKFINSNPNKTIISYGDNVRARHLLENNTFINSGIIKTDKFVVDNDK